jgi:hypothetical protein
MNDKERSLGMVLKHLYVLFPVHKTLSPGELKTSLNSRYPARYSEYYQLLTHFITIMNSPRRVKERGYYITQKEDIISSLYILERVYLKDYRVAEEQARDFYLQVKSVLPAKAVFTRTVLQNLLDMPKTTLHHRLTLLADHGYLERTGGHKNRGYEYRLK